MDAARRNLSTKDTPTMEALEALTTRASPLTLGEPGPDGGAIEVMLCAAARAPDHGRLRPWRFIVIAGNARQALGDVLAAALHRREPDASPATLDKERAKPLRAPLVVIVVARVREHRNVPAIEQVISAGAAAQNILVAAHALGFGGFWRTGAAAYDSGIKEALGLRPQDAIVGFLYLGTIAVPAPSLPRSAPAEFVVYWTGPAPVSQTTTAPNGTDQTR
jgi:nitroreductase